MEDKLTLSPVQQRGTKFTVEQKEEAVRTWIATGNLRIAASVVGCTVQTIEAWKKQEWWNHYVASIKTEKNLVLGNKLESIADRSLDIIEDRLVNGDFVLNNKTGQVIRKPVALKDVTNVANSLLTRKSVIDQQENHAVERKESMQEMLTALSKEFASWALKDKRRNAETIEFKESDNALYEEREEGLQEGSSSVHLETGSEEEES
jgi:uncharacterized protein YjcR